ncbi:hypothetical protein D3C81_1262300 [compost metagenome]
MLAAHGHAGLQLFAQLGFDIKVGTDHAAVQRHGIDLGDARVVAGDASAGDGVDRVEQGAVGPAGGVTFAEVVVFLAPSQPGGNGQRLEQPVVGEVAGPVQGQAGLVGFAATSVDGRRAGGAPAGVDGVAVGGVDAVIAVVQRQVEFAQGLVLEAQATGDGKVFQAVAGDR